MKVTLEVSDYTKSGVFMPFMGDMKYFRAPYNGASGPAHSISKLFWVENDTSSNKGTSKMNVRLRGTNGKFVSYKDLPEGMNGLREAIEALPNI